MGNSPSLQQYIHRKQDFLGHSYHLYSSLAPGITAIDCLCTSCWMQANDHLLKLLTTVQAHTSRTFAQLPSTKNTNLAFWASWPFEDLVIAAVVVGTRILGSAPAAWVCLSAS